jgi:hypothetical protein
LVAEARADQRRGFEAERGLLAFGEVFDDELE